MTNPMEQSESEQNNASHFSRAADAPPRQNQLKAALESLEGKIQAIDAAVSHQSAGDNSTPAAPTMTMSQLIASIDQAGPTIVAALLTIPFLQPVPLFGLSSPAGLTIALSGVGLLLAKPIWLPKTIADIKIRTETIRKTVKILIEFEEKLKPYVNNGSLAKLTLAPPDRLKRVLGAWIAIHGVLLALPLPIPFSNALPAWACLLASLTVLFGSRRLFFFTSAMVAANIVFWLGLVVATAWGIPTLMQYFRN